LLRRLKTRAWSRRAFVCRMRLSACSDLRFFHLTTQSPFETWLAIDRKARLPKVDYRLIRFAAFRGPT